MKYPQIFTFLFSVGLLFFSSSCSHKFYNSGDNVGLQISEAKELKISTSYNTINQRDEKIGESYSAQIAYSPTKHLAFALISAQTSLSNFELYPSQTTNSSQGRLFEGAIGTYAFYNTRTSPQKIGFLFDLYGGYGNGKITNFNLETKDNAIFFHKYYFQTGIHIVSKGMEKETEKGLFKQRLSSSFGFSMKFGLLDYYNFFILLDGPEDASLYRLFNNLIDSEKTGFFETSVNFQIGIRPVKFITTASFLTTESLIFNQSFDASLKTGILLDLDYLFQKRKKK